MGSVLLILLVFCIVILCVFTFWGPCCDVLYDFAYKRCSIHPVVCWRAHVLVTLLCLLAHSGVQHILFCVFALFIFDLYLVYTMLPVSLDCPFVIVPSVFSSVYLCVTNPVISHEWGNDRIVITTSGTYTWSFVTQILRSDKQSHIGDNNTFE
jgi:hypothetical protein